MPSTKSYRELHDQVMARPGAAERLAALRADTLAEIGLYELRRALDLSQSELAAELGISQSAISQLERAGDVKLSTLQNYLEHLGARLELSAVFEEDDEEHVVPIRPRARPLQGRQRRSSVQEPGAKPFGERARRKRYVSARGKAPSGRLVPEGVLAGHYRQGRRFTPPIMAMPGSMANEWVRDDLPDLLWPLCLVAMHGDSGAVLYRKFQELVIDVVGEAKIDELGIVVDGRLTSIERIPAKVRDEIVESLRSHARFEDLLPAEILGVLRLYVDLPGRWLLVDPWVEMEAVDVEAAMNHLGRAIVSVVGDRHLNALVKVSVFGWIILSGRLSMPAEAGDVLIDYPTNDPKRDAADAMILSSFLAFKSIDVLADPEVGEQRTAWARRFWDANRELSACLPADEIERMNETEEIDTVEEDGVQAQGSADTHESPAVSLSELVDHYLDRLRSITANLAEVFYAPDLALNIYQPARSEVLVGLATRAIRGVGAIIRAPHMWTGENGANVMRMLFETRVVLLWLLAQEDAQAFAQYQDYGRGKRKLHKRHVEAVVEELGESTPDEVMSVLEMLETRTGGEWAEEFQEVSVEGTFSGKKLRTMADEVGELDSYNYLFQTASGVTHGEWWSLEEYALQRCLNPLHRFHFVPFFDLDEPELHPRFPEIMLGHLENVVALVVEGLAGEES